MKLPAPQTIAAIGAGLAGLSCAQALLQAGHMVHVFDKSRGPSGRMSTRCPEDEHGAWLCDHGTQYFTARDPAFRAEVAHWQRAGVAAVWDARLASFDGSIWTTPHTPLERFVGTPRMTSPAAWLVQSLGDRAQAQWQTTVQRLDHHLRRARPTPRALRRCDVGGACPAGRTVARPRSARWRCRGRWAVMLRYAAPVAMPWEGAFINTGPLRWVARDSSKPGRCHVEPELPAGHGVQATPKCRVRNSMRCATMPLTCARGWMRYSPPYPSPNATPTAGPRHVSRTAPRNAVHLPAVSATRQRKLARRC
nr:NAD(P)-binding protein [Acidovorax sp. sif1233]